jgi:hypothetical protein
VRRSPACNRPLRPLLHRRRSKITPAIAAEPEAAP